MGRQGPFKRWSRKVRQDFYLWRHGTFSYHGIPVHVPEHMPFGVKKGLMRGTYEEPERALIERFLRRDLPVIELGGSLGIVSAFVNYRLDPGVPYVIVEANPDLIETCRTNATLGRGADHTHVIHAACAYGAPTISFSVGEHIHSSRLTMPGETHQGRTIEVNAIALSELVSRYAQGGRYSLIMDIESAEWDVFEHDAAAFSQCDHAIIEVHPDIFAHQGRSLERFMEMTRAAGLSVVAQIQQTYAFARV